MHKLKLVYIFIGLATVIIALTDMFYITINRYEIIINAMFFLRVSILLGIFIEGIKIIKKIEKTFIDIFVNSNVKLAEEKIFEDHREIIIEKHEIARKLQIVQSYVKMKKLDELEKLKILEEEVELNGVNKNNERGIGSSKN